MKRLLSILLLTVLVTLPTVVFARSFGMPRAGSPEAFPYFCNILSKMEEHGQVLEYDGQAWTLSPSPQDGGNFVSPAERRFLIRMLSPYLGQEGKARQAAYDELAEAIRSQPPVNSEYTVDFGCGQTLRASVMLTGAVEAQPPAAAPGVLYTFDAPGTQAVSFELTEEGPLYQFAVALTAQITASEQALQVSHVSGAQACTGLVSIASAAYAPDSAETLRVTETGDWTDVRSDVVFVVSPSLGPQLQSALRGALGFQGGWTHSLILRAEKSPPFGVVSERIEAFSL